MTFSFPAASPSLKCHVLVKESPKAQGRAAGTGWAGRLGVTWGGTGEPRGLKVSRVILDLSLGESKGSKGEPLTK